MPANNMLPIQQKCNQDVFVTSDKNYIIIFKRQLFFKAVIFLSSEKADLKQLENRLTVLFRNFLYFILFLRRRTKQPDFSLL